MCFENVLCKALYGGKKWGFEVASRRCGIRSKPQPLLRKTCLSYASETLAAYVGMCMLMQALAYVHKPKAILIILFPKIDFCSFKTLYFPFLHSSSQFNI